MLFLLGFCGQILLILASKLFLKVQWFSLSLLRPMAWLNCISVSFFSKGSWSLLCNNLFMLGCYWEVSFTEHGWELRFDDKNPSCSAVSQVHGHSRGAVVLGCKPETKLQFIKSWCLANNIPYQVNLVILSVSLGLCKNEGFFLLILKRNCPQVQYRSVFSIQLFFSRITTFFLAYLPLSHWLFQLFLCV